MKIRLFLLSLSLSWLHEKREDTRKESWSWRRVFLLIQRTKRLWNILKKFKKNMKKNKNWCTQGKQSNSISIVKSWRWKMLLRWISMLKIISISLLGSQISTTFQEFNNKSFRLQAQIWAMLLMNYRLKEGYLQLLLKYQQIWIKRELMNSSIKKMSLKDKGIHQVHPQSQRRKERKTRKLKTKAVVMQTWRKTKKQKKEDEK